MRNNRIRVLTLWSYGASNDVSPVQGDSGTNHIMDEPFGLLLFLSLFVIPGGAALGAAARGFMRHDYSNFFFLVWGAGFAGIPFFIGSVMFLGQNQLGYFYALLFIFLIPIVTVAFLPNDFMETSNHLGGAEGIAILGAVLLTLGGTIVLLNLRAGFGVAMLLGGAIALVGMYFLLRTAIRVLRAP